MADPKLVMLVANQTATTDRLREAVRLKAAEGDVRFHLVVPAKPQGLHRLVDPEVAGKEEARARLEAAIPLLSEDADAPVTGEVGCAEPLAAIHDALAREQFDEIIVSTLPRRMSKWLRVDLPSKVRGYGLPVTHVEASAAPEAARTTAGAPGGAQPSEPIVRDGMNKIVVTVSPGDTLREAARRMTEQNVGAAVVMEDGAGLGIITERDLLRSIGRGQDCDEELVGDHIAPHVIYAHEDWSLERAAEKMTEGGFRHVIVLNRSGDPSAILSMRDIVRCWIGRSSERQPQARDAAA
jgi:CBS domain-containing protein